MINMIRGTRAYQQIEQVNASNRTAKTGDDVSPQSAVSGAANPDMLEISQQARELNEGGETRNLQSVQNKIDQGFYNSPEVLRTVARKLSGDL
ncbi:MAG: hypothetical protein JNJ85_13285 [Candidatus Kapabacteria bacterium]|nr:hypothetical protein [Candidatus Kapabacteria bacterium]